MQFFLTLRHDGEAVLPLNYGHYVQSLIYNILSCGGSYSKFLHDEGHTFQSKSYRLFTFGRLNGRHRILDKTIIFPSDIYLEIRSSDDEFCYVFRRGLESADELYLKDIPVVLGAVKIGNRLILESSLKIRTAAPICVYTTDTNGKRNFLSPADEDFKRLIYANFTRKFAALYGIVPEDGISLSLLRSGRREATHFGGEKKGSWIFGWHGQFIIAGNPQYLQFLYNTGIGSKNSQGFGMFDIV